MPRQGRIHNYSKSEKMRFAKKLRANPTPAEEFLWSHIKRSTLGAKFRRQSLVCGWIADFYSPAAKLVIELDGNGHDKAKDRFRDRTMRKSGIFTLRFTNEEVFKDTRAVLACIRMMIEP